MRDRLTPQEKSEWAAVVPGPQVPDCERSMLFGYGHPTKL